MIWHYVPIYKSMWTAIGYIVQDEMACLPQAIKQKEKYMSRWYPTEDERRGREDYENYHRPDYERDKYSHKDEEYFNGYKEAEREEERRQERREEERQEEERQERESHQRHIERMNEEEYYTQPQQEQQCESEQPQPDAPANNPG